MNENLMVNSKTNILEFKRKHNLLVGRSSIKISVTNIATLTDTELNNLKCGDLVQKKTGNQFHNYIVTYKEENKGICLSYYAYGYTETVSYDYEDGHWSYNSTDISLCNSLEEIKDKDGHERFIEGNITMETITGVSQSYGKWSLSGTHLMIVIAGAMADTTAISWGTKLADVNLPQWIIDKLVPIASEYVDVKTSYLFSNTLSSQSVLSLLKKSGGKISINLASITANTDKTFRFQFDLLIDNE